MASSSAVVTPAVVRRVAELARLRLPEEELPLWTEQLGRIVGYIEQLNQIPADASGAEPERFPTPLRADEPRPGGGDKALEDNAPRLSHGYGVVPRVVGSGG